jgi:hypothetical protein
MKTTSYDTLDGGLAVGPDKPALGERLMNRRVVAVEDAAEIGQPQPPASNPAIDIDGNDGVEAGSHHRP